MRLMFTVASVATNVFRLTLTKFRPNSDQKYTEIQTDFDHFQQKFRPTETHQPDAFTTTLFYRHS